MTQHISVRVPWHDHGWDGTVCEDPESNIACLRLKNISENRNDKEEAKICGRCMAGHADDLICIGEGAGFMSPYEIIRTTEHPYKKCSQTTHGHFFAYECYLSTVQFPSEPICMADERKS